MSGSLVMAYHGIEENNQLFVVGLKPLQGHVCMMQYLYSKGADAAAVSSIRATALHLAAAGGHAVAVAWLLTTLGPKAVAAAAADGSTALHLAVAHGQKRYLGVVRLLLQHGATPAVQVGG